MWWYDGSTGDDVVAPGGKVQPPGAGKAGTWASWQGAISRTRCWCEGRWREALTIGKMTSLQAATLVPCRFLEVLVWRCRARLPKVLVSFLNVFDDCSSVRRGLSPREKAIFREVIETVFSLNFLETGCTLDSESCAKKVGYSILSTDLASPALRRLHFEISDFRPTSVTESGEAVLRRLLASRAIGSYSLTCDDPAPGSLNRVPAIASCSATGCLAVLLMLSHRC